MGGGLGGAPGDREHKDEEGTLLEVGDSNVQEHCIRHLPIIPSSSST